MPKAPFSLHKRPTSKREDLRRKQGKSYQYVYYAQFRDSTGHYKTAVSTGLSNKNAAREWCRASLRLTQKCAINLSFREYADSWWIPGSCLYLKERARTGHRLSEMYIRGSRSNLENHIQPYFKGFLLSEITPYLVRQFTYSLTEKKNLSPATANRIIANLKVMLKEAVARDLLPSNPAESIGVYREEKYHRELLTLCEAQSILNPQTVDEIWEGNLKVFTFNLLAATTGMRLGELQGLTIKNVDNGRIIISQSWSQSGRLKTTKNGEERLVPIPELVSTFIHRIAPEDMSGGNGDNLLFSGKDANRPISPSLVSKTFGKALNYIGIDDSERRRRALSFHSWRHFFNTVSRQEDIPDVVLRKVMGHKTPAMTEHYTSVAMDELTSVMTIQEMILDFGKTRGKK